MDPRAQFAANLRALRTASGLTQEQLGYAAGVHLTEISRLERATRDPRLTTIVRLARALGTTASELLSSVR